MAKRGGKGDADFTSWTRARRFGIEISGSALRGILSGNVGRGPSGFLVLACKKKRKILFFITMIEKNFRRGFAPRHTPPGAYAAPWTPRELGRG